MYDTGLMAAHHSCMLAFNITSASGIGRPGTMSGSPHVLVISQDSMLLESRQLILRPFFQVEGADSADAAMSLMASRRYDLLVLCHSLAEAECLLIVNTARKKLPPPKILSLIPAHGRSEREYSVEEVGIDSLPNTLLQKSAEILGLDLKSKVPLARS